MKFLADTEKVLNIIFRTLGQIGIVFLLGIILVTVADVFMRYVFDKPIVGTTEIVEAMMLTVSFLGLIWCTLLQGHIKVDLMTKFIPRRARLISESFFYLLGIVLYTAISWQNFKKIISLMEDHAATEVLRIPVPPLFMIIVGASCCVILILLMAIIKNIIEVTKRSA